MSTGVKTRIRLPRKESAPKAPKVPRGIKLSQKEINQRKEAHELRARATSERQKKAERSELVDAIAAEVMKRLEARNPALFEASQPADLAPVMKLVEDLQVELKDAEARVMAAIPEKASRLVVSRDASGRIESMGIE